MLIYCFKIQYSTAPATRTEVQLPCPSYSVSPLTVQLEGEGHRRSFLIIMFSSTYTNVINLLYVFKNIRIMYERFLTISYSRIKDTGRVDDLM